MNEAQTKKLVRIFFYGLGIASGLTLLSMLILMFTEHWEDMWPIVVIVTISVATYFMFKLANWAFTPDRNITTESDFPVPAKGKTND